MTKEELIKKVKDLDYPQQLDKGYEGSCPCFWYHPTIDGKRVSIHGHCWRTTGDNMVGSCKCAYNGLHITGKLPEKDLLEIAKAFKRQLDKQKWYSEWDIVINEKFLANK
jgi:hypothetical protein